MVTQERIGSVSTLHARRELRYFFPAMVLLAMVVVGWGFIPEYLEFRRGTFPIAWVLHLHGAIMGAWVATFAVQAWLGATGEIKLHRSLGEFGIWVGVAAWVSMIFVEVRALRVYPLPSDPASFDFMLNGPYVYLTFPIFLAWGYRERRRPQWHKRILTFALFLSLQAAIQRFQWLPHLPGHFRYLPFALFLDVILLAPVVIYDLRLDRRIHAATLRAASIVVIVQIVLISLWSTATWGEFAYRVARAVHP